MLPPFPCESWRKWKGSEGWPPVGVNAVPFQAYSAYFSLENIKALRKAYTLALDDLSAERITLPPDEIPALRQKLAQLILASPCSGKRNVDELKQIALRGASKRRR